MITFQIAARVKADRQLLLTLPPDVPLGAVEIAIAVATVNQLGAALPDTDSEFALPRTGPAEPERPEEIERVVAAPSVEEESIADAACMLVDVPDAATRGSVVGESVAASPAPAVELPISPPVVSAPAADEARAIVEAPPVAEVAALVPAPAPPPAAPVAPSRPAARETQHMPRPVIAAPLQVGTVLGDYRLLKKLGAGALGPVFVARQDRLNRDAAVKVLAGEAARNPECVQRFLEQGQRLTRLEHCSILRSYAVGEAHGHTFLATELMEEGNLEAALKRLGKLSVKIADFGLTRVRNGAGTDLTALAYLAPEQAGSARHMDQRSDVYSLGCLLYVLLTGTPPFSGAAAAELLAAKEAGTFTPARQRNADVPERLESILARMLAVNPEQRYQSCAALSLEVEALRLASSRLGLALPRGNGPAPPRVTATPPPPRKLRMRELEAVEGYWYAKLEGSDGAPVVRKVTYRQMLALVKNKSADAETLVSHHKDHGFAPLASCAEFRQFFSSQEVTQARASRERMPEPARDPANMADWLHQEFSKKAPVKKRLSRRGWFRQVLAWRGGRGRWLVAGGAAALLTGGFFAVNHTFWFWRLKRKIRSWFGH
jgi:eukaryotic-like serine/threonine-protein kinase